MKEFEDSDGRIWTATVEQETGPDYKGRYHLVFTPSDTQGEALEMVDVRWNTERTARRTLQTMSDVELRRRLRQAQGRHSLPVTP